MPFALLGEEGWRTMDPFLPIEVCVNWYMYVICLAWEFMDLFLPIEVSHLISLCICLEKRGGELWTLSYQLRYVWNFCQRYGLCSIFQTLPGSICFQSDFRWLKTFFVIESYNCVLRNYEAKKQNLLLFSLLQHFNSLIISYHEGASIQWSGAGQCYWLQHGERQVVTNYSHFKAKHWATWH